MILLGYSLGNVLLSILYVSAGVLVVFIAYRKFLAYLGKGRIITEDYCTLYSLDKDFAKDEIEIYFTTIKPIKAKILLINDDLSVNQLIKEADFSEGGHIVRFDTSLVSNGTYYYCLESELQKTMKKIEIKN